MKTYRAGTQPPFLASKWLHAVFLLDHDEMALLFDTLGKVLFFPTLGPVAKEQLTISREQFLDGYKRYLSQLISGPVHDEEFRPFFTAVLTKDEDAVALLELPDNRYIIQPVLPLVQMRPHRFVYSKEDGKFREMVFGSHSISWGVQLSYPSLFQEPSSRMVHNALAEDFINKELWKAIQGFLRKETLPTPFLVDGVKTNSPMRLGRNCFRWINSHQELMMRHIKVGDGDDR